MKYLSIDLETTGVDERNSNVVEFGAVIFDLDKKQTRQELEALPTFHTYVSPPTGTDETYIGQPYALSMHPTIFRRIATREKGYEYTCPKNVEQKFYKFLIDNGFEKSLKDDKIHITAAGKNFGVFDMRFINHCLGFGNLIRIRHRIIDVGTVYFDPTRDATPPNTEECKKRAGISNTTVAHTAVADALDVIECLQTHYCKAE